MLAFTHIPKTGGTTVTDILINEYGTKLISIIPRNGQTYGYSDLKEDLQIYKDPLCIAGHYLKPFVDFKEYDERMEWFTFLRDPIKTFISLYIHQFTGKSAKYKVEFSDWMTKFNRKNRIVNWIAGENNLEKAKEIIERKFKFIGITEKFDESLVLLKEKFNLRSIDYSSKMETRDLYLKNQLLNNLARFEDQIMLNNDLDTELYRYVLNKIFPLQIEKMGYDKFSKSLQEIKQKKQTGNHTGNAKINKITYRVKRNLVYKPFVFLNTGLKKL